MVVNVPVTVAGITELTLSRLEDVRLEESKEIAAVTRSADPRICLSKCRHEL
jgi:hypothetical protein